MITANELAEAARLADWSVDVTAGNEYVHVERGSVTVGASSGSASGASAAQLRAPDQVLADADTVTITTASGHGVTLAEPAVLDIVVPLVAPLLQVVKKVAPDAELLPVPQGVWAPKESQSHDGHKGIYPQGTKVSVAGVDVTASVKGCLDCRAHLFGRAPLTKTAPASRPR